MLPCWTIRADQRPDCDEICEQLESMRRGTPDSYYAVDGKYSAKPPPGYYAPENMNRSRDNEYKESTVYDDGPNYCCE